MLPQIFNVHFTQDSQDLSFWEDIAQRNSFPFLELGCGTGRVLRAIAHTNRYVYGIDKDHDMLSFLVNNLPADIKPKVHVLQAEMSTFHLDKRFGVIGLPCNTYSTLPDSERNSTLQIVFHHLREDGIFAVSVPNPAALVELPIQGDSELEGFITHPMDNEPIHMFSSWEKTTDKVIMYWHYDHLQQDGNIHRITTRIEHYLTSKVTYIKEFQNTGFMNVDIFGDYDYSTFDQDSPYLIVVAQK